VDGIVTDLNVINETDVRGLALRKLIDDHIKFPQVRYGFRAEGGLPGLQYPSCFVEPKSSKAVQTALGKLKRYWTYAVYWYCRDNDVDQVITQSTFIAEAMVKLLSFDALGDLSTKATKLFQQYPNPAGGYYWLDSTIVDIRYGTTFLDPKASGMRFERAARMLVEMMDEIRI
jgi:hypothetical protein